MKKINKIFLSSLALLPTTFALVAAKCKTNNPKPNPVPNVEFAKALGIEVAKKATKASEFDVNTFVKEIRQAKSWEAIAKIFDKYGIQYKYNPKDLEEGATFEVMGSTHGHADQGMIHLDIMKKVNGAESGNTRFEIYGFKVEKIEKEITIGNFKFQTKAKKEAKKLQIAELKDELEKAQKESFDKLLEVLGKYLNFEKIDKTNTTSKIWFDFDEAEILTDAAQLHLEAFTYENDDLANKKEADELKITNLNDGSNSDFEEQLGIAIGKTAEDASNISADAFVADIKFATSWEDIAKVLDKYKVAYKYDKNTLEPNTTFEVSLLSHSHKDAGLVHLTIIKKVNGIIQESFMFEISGFKEELAPEEIILGNYKFQSKAKEAAKNLKIDELLKELNDAQAKGFDELLKALEKYVTFEKIDPSNTSSKLFFDFINGNEIERSKGYVLIHAYEYQNDDIAHKTYFGNLELTNLKTE